jgi:hypothetical protein
MSEFLIYFIQMAIVISLWWKIQEVENRWTKERKLEEKLWLLDDQVNRIALYLEKGLVQKE